jgi:myo-inositol-1(or 4)-monophosphatase
VVVKIGEEGSTCRNLREVAENAARILREYFDKEEYMEILGSNVTGDAMRKIDLLAEEYIVGQVRSLGLKAWVISEEKGLWKLAEQPDYYVLVDPLDGSLNYASKIPFASVSIAVYESPYLITRPIYGVVQSIFTETTIEICKGKPFFNGKHLKRPFELSTELVSIYTENARHLEELARYFASRGVKLKTRTMGSAALEAAYAAIGLIGGFIHVTGKLRNVDIAVALALAESLGTRFYTEPVNVRVDGVYNIEKVAISVKNSDLVNIVKHF